MGLTPRISIQRLPGNKYNFNQSEGLVIAWRPNLAPASKEHSMTLKKKSIKSNPLVSELSCLSVPGLEPRQPCH